MNMFFNSEIFTPKASKQFLIVDLSINQIFKSIKQVRQAMVTCQFSYQSTIQLTKYQLS